MVEQIDFSGQVLLSAVNYSQILKAEELHEC